MFDWTLPPYGAYIPVQDPVDEPVTDALSFPNEAKRDTLADAITETDEGRSYE